LTRKGRSALLTVVLVTALVLTPLILGGVYLGYYVGDVVGYSKSILAIAFSTAGFLIGMLVIFRVIRIVVAAGEAPKG
jgi:hypothetical protein